MQSARESWEQHRAALTPISLLVGLYGFVLALTGFKESWGLVFAADSSGGFVQRLLDASLATPFTALLSGVVITSLIQSSSATIALVVATIGSGVISVDQSVFLLMGANVGTTVTNSIVGLARAHRNEELERLVPAIVVDDVFKVLNVMLFFFVEISTGMLHGLASWIVGSLSHTSVFGSFLELFPDVIDKVTEPVTLGAIAVLSRFGMSPGVEALAAGFGFFLLLVMSLGLMGESLKRALHDQSRALLSRVFGGRMQAFMIGFGVCWLLQSSSVAVSLLLPLVGHSAVTLPTVYHYSLGAALATTCDPGQIVSYLKFGEVGLAAGVVHILLNVFGAILFLLVPGLRTAPLAFAESIGDLMCSRRHAAVWLAIYVGAAFFVLPMLVVLGVQLIG